jgi:hypothetical protein
MGKHAILSPSGASRWLSCTPSARLEQTFPDRSNDAADEGTAAHKLAEIELKFMFGFTTAQQYRNERADFVKTSKWYCQDMANYIDDFCAYVEEAFNSAGEGAQIFLEVELNLNFWVPEGFGTGDVIIVSDTVAILIDLKYGKGVSVSAFENKQLRLYSLGVVFHFGLTFGFKRIVATIYQPRIDNITTDEITVKALETWAEEVLKPRALLAFAGTGEFVVGEHCTFCRAAPECRALAEANLKIIQTDFGTVENVPAMEMLTVAEYVEILAASARVRSWLKSIERHALVEALRGRKWPGYKVVQGRSSRKWSEPLVVETRLLSLNYLEDQIFEPSKLLSVAQIEKVVGKKKLPDMLGSLIHKSSGAPALVPESDKRIEYKPAEVDFAEFAELDDDE